MLWNSLHRGRLRQHRPRSAGWSGWSGLTTVSDCRLGAGKLLPCCCSSLLEVIAGRGELPSVQSWRALRKECSTWFPGAVVSEIGDRCRLLSGIVGVLVRSKASWGRQKISPIRRIQTPKDEEKAILNAQIQIHERVREPNWGRRSIDELLCACRHALRAAAVHALFSQ